MRKEERKGGREGGILRTDGDVCLFRCVCDKTE